MGGDRMLSFEEEAQVNALFPLAVVAMREITASSSDERLTSAWICRFGVEGGPQWRDYGLLNYPRIYRDG